MMILAACWLPLLVAGQSESADDNAPIVLLNDITIQVEATQAVNDLYNFRFNSAELQFRYLKNKYPWHPLPYFLLGLSQWWKIAPEMETTTYDWKFFAYMDTCIAYAKQLYDHQQYHIEGAFFLTASYGFKARLLSDRKSWRKAATAGKRSLNYLEDCKNYGELSPELLFGDALYNYYSVWIPENYPILKPMLVFFRKGDKEKGIRQLKEVARNAFYTRTEAQYFLMRILSEEKNLPEAMQISDYLAKTFPGNAYFQRYHARLLYSTGQYTRCELVSEKILEKIDSNEVGYGPTSGRYAAFYLGHIYENRREMDKAKYYFERTVRFGEENEATETGYYLYALIGLAKIAEHEQDYELAEEYLKQVKDYAKRKHPAHETAREFLKEVKKKRKRSRRR